METTLKKQTMDGIIMGTHSLMHDEYMKIGKPVVAFDRFLGDDIPIVRADHEMGGTLAASKFIEKIAAILCRSAGRRYGNFGMSEGSAGQGAESAGGITYACL